MGLIDTKWSNYPLVTVTWWQKFKRNITFGGCGWGGHFPKVISLHHLEVNSRTIYLFTFPCLFLHKTLRQYLTICVKIPSFLYNIWKKYFISSNILYSSKITGFNNAFMFLTQLQGSSTQAENISKFNNWWQSKCRKVFKFNDWK